MRALAARALREPSALERILPLAQPSSPYGDLVPLGFLLLALDRAAEARGSEAIAGEAQRVRERLMQRRTRGLWAYQSGDLETSIDSGLILLSVRDRASIDALERFATGDGRYVPQLFTRGVEPGKMTVRDSLLHWCQPDYSIACLVRALRARAGLPAVTPLSVLSDGFETRAGLYLANPYFPDWLLALALEGDAGGAALRERLQREILAGAQPDGTFGRFDAPLSTALAVLALRALGTSTAVLARHVRALVDLTESDATATPFYSTEQIAWSRLPPWELLARLTAGRSEQLIRAGGAEHVITWYRDPEGLVVQPLIALALLGASAAGEEPGRADEPPKARYLCSTAADYIANHALAPCLEPPMVSA
ncbi:MAG: hypothetical protein QM820_64615 [Minicystis sp.]